ncbi:MAG: hypothetical protein E7462_05340 [Ruminococcaceae bacterium]|nr:hypothetical protein [Oscillospiraceae bacterium]
MKLYAAVGKTDITDVSAKMHDNLFAKILLLSNGEKTVALISMDYICLGGGGIGVISKAFFPALKKELEKQGVCQVLCGTTHTHTHGRMITDEDVILQRILRKVQELKDELIPVTVGVAETK